MIATVHRYRSSLPGRRVELYAEMCEVLLSKRQEVKGMTQQLSAKQQMRVVQTLAYNMMLQGKREINRSDLYKIIQAPLSMVNSKMQPEGFLRLIEETSGLVLEQEHNRYGFAHLTFQEFLAATYLHENNEHEMLVSKVPDEWWHETIRLYCAQADASLIIQACLVGNPTAKLLALALECRDEALAIQPKVSEQLDKFLQQSIEASDLELRRVVAEALLTKRLR